MSHATFAEWVRSEAARIGSDGCSAVMGFYVDECLVHDLAYFYARDPSDAYLLWVQGEVEPWTKAAPITRGEADARFRKGHQVRSKFGRYSPMSWWRWLGVRIGGKGAWEKHRQREAREAGV